MRRSFKYIALCGSVFLLMLAAGTWLQQPLQPTSEQIEQLIQSELPNGSSKFHVLAFLDAHHIIHSGYEERRATQIDTDLQGEKFAGKHTLSKTTSSPTYEAAGDGLCSDVTST
jgi:hypothetical protein